MHETISKQLVAEAIGGLTADLCAGRGWTLHVTEFPVLEIGFSADRRMPVRLRLQCVEWDASPPSIEWRDVNGGVLTNPPTTPGAQFNNSPHPATGRPFICMAGSREYHTHPSHLGDPWENYRGRSGYDLGGIVTQVWRAWLKGQQ